MADVWTLRMRVVFVGSVWEHREGEKIECYYVLTCKWGDSSV